MLKKPISYASWIKETTVSGFFGEKNRSKQLTAIDKRLQAYETAPHGGRLGALHRLCDAYEAWYAEKTKKNAAGPLESIRNSENQMLVFEEWLQEEQDRLLPAPEDGWGPGPNCYAYAMKCKRPVGNGMAPGIAGGEGATMEGIETRPIEYTKRLFKGIRLDAAKDNMKTVSFFPPDIEDADVRPDPSLMPSVVPRNEYLVAMLVTAGGFHFMRRDSNTNLWSHRNGSYGAVEASVQHIGSGRLGSRSSAITNEVAIEILKNQMPGLIYQPLGGGFVFAGYILVPEDGIEVSGVTRRFE